jgi:hypothetical protein
VPRPGGEDENDLGCHVPVARMKMSVGNVVLAATLHAPWPRRLRLFYQTLYFIYYLTLYFKFYFLNSIIYDVSILYGRLHESLEKWR